MRGNPLISACIASLLVIGCGATAPKVPDTTTPVEIKPHLDERLITACPKDMPELKGLTHQDLIDTWSAAQTQYQSCRGKHIELANWVCKTFTLKEQTCSDLKIFLTTP